MIIEDQGWIGKAMAKNWEISEVVKKFNDEGFSISSHTLRDYEEKQLIPTLKREEGERRTYSEDDLWFIRKILYLRLIGISIPDIRRLTHFWFDHHRFKGSSGLSCIIPIMGDPHAGGSPETTALLTKALEEDPEGYRSVYGIFKKIKDKVSQMQPKINLLGEESDAMLDYMNGALVIKKGPRWLRDGESLAGSKE